MQLYSTEGYGKAQGVKIIVYGKAGLGKTTLCATCPNPIILSAESGLLSLAGLRLPYAPIARIEDLREAYRWANGSQEAKQFQTICLDSISDIAETVLASSKVKVKDGRLAYGDMMDTMQVKIGRAHV